MHHDAQMSLAQQAALAFEPIARFVQIHRKTVELFEIHLPGFGDVDRGVARGRDVVDVRGLPTERQWDAELMDLKFLAPKLDGQGFEFDGEFDGFHVSLQQLLRCFAMNALHGDEVKRFIKSF